jgi:hypothetical protein
MSVLHRSCTLCGCPLTRLPEQGTALKCRFQDTQHETHVGSTALIFGLNCHGGELERPCGSLDVGKRSGAYVRKQCEDKLRREEHPGTHCNKTCCIWAALPVHTVAIEILTFNFQVQDDLVPL